MYGAVTFRSGSVLSFQFKMIAPAELVAVRPVGAAGGVVSTALGVTLLDVAMVEPVAFVAVTAHVIAFAASADTVVYVTLVAPEMFVPARFHWYEKLVGLLLHVPFVVVRAPGTEIVVGVTAGATVFAGADSAVGVTAFDVADAEPDGFVAVTMHVIALPASPETTT
jgi:hypothetical protein